MTCFWDTWYTCCFQLNFPTIAIQILNVEFSNNETKAYFVATKDNVTLNSASVFSAFANDTHEPYITEAFSSINVTISSVKLTPFALVSTVTSSSTYVDTTTTESTTSTAVTTASVSSTNSSMLSDTVTTTIAGNLTSPAAEYLFELGMVLFYIQVLRFLIKFWSGFWSSSYNSIFKTFSPCSILIALIDGHEILPSAEYMFDLSKVLFQVKCFGFCYELVWAVFLKLSLLPSYFKLWYSVCALSMLHLHRILVWNSKSPKIYFSCFLGATGFLNTIPRSAACEWFSIKNKIWFDR